MPKKNSRTRGLIKIMILELNCKSEYFQKKRLIAINLFKRYYSKILISVLRLSCLPSSVSLDATGFDSPYPFAIT